MTITAQPTNLEATRNATPIGLCWECNYPLRGLPESRCPECGRTFDPDDPASMNLGKPMGRLAKRLLRPDAWYGRIVVCYVLLAMVGSVLLPMNRWALLQTFFVFWMLMSAPYLVRRTLRHLVIKRYAQPAASAQVDDQMVRRVGHVLAWGALLRFAQAPLYLALFVSGPWLNALARERYEQMPFLTVNRTPLDHNQYGLFRIIRVEVDPRGARLLLWRDAYDAPRLRYAPGEASWEDFLLGNQLTPSWTVD